MRNEDKCSILSNFLPFWEKLNSEQKTLLADNAKTVEYKKKAIIHHGSNDCIGILLINKGTVRTYMISAEGREITLYKLNKNDICILSASCILSVINFDVFVEAQTDCEILQVNSKTLSQLIEKNIYVELFSYKLATARFSDVMSAMEQLLFTKFDKRLAKFLINESTKQNSTTIKITQEEIAKNLGTAREVVSRCLNSFAKNDILTISRGAITIQNQDALKII